jgi:hypothetical protein
MKSFRVKAAVNAGNSRLVSATWANYNQRAVLITAVSRKKKESEKLDLCRPVTTEVTRTSVSAVTLVIFFKFFSSPFSTAQSASVISWKVMIFI